MQWRFLPQRIAYTGCELRAHWIYDQTGLAGDAVVGFCGPASVPVAHMVDREDVRRGEGIRAAGMLHLIAEHFDADLLRTVLRQRLLVCLAAELLQAAGVAVARQGDDLFLAERKLSVSIATASPVSTLIHLGLNVDPTGAPVPAVGLTELGILGRELAEQLMSAYVSELASCEVARCKVRGVH